MGYGACIYAVLRVLQSKIELMPEPLALPRAGLVLSIDRIL